MFRIAVWSRRVLLKIRWSIYIDAQGRSGGGLVLHSFRSLTCLAYRTHNSHLETYASSCRYIPGHHYFLSIIWIVTRKGWCPSAWFNRMIPSRSSNLGRINSSPRFLMRIVSPSSSRRTYFWYFLIFFLVTLSKARFSILLGSPSPWKITW
jgi:hypothetical protein